MKLILKGETLILNDSKNPKRNWRYRVIESKNSNGGLTSTITVRKLLSKPKNK